MTEQFTWLRTNQFIREIREHGADCHVEDGVVHLAKDKSVYQGEKEADCYVGRGQSSSPG